MMEFLDLCIDGLKLFIPKLLRDSRGYFLESYNLHIQNVLNVGFCQDNESGSSKFVLRGLHFQVPPFAQGKLIRVVRGSIWDVAVDLRQGSPTYGKYHAEILSGENKHIYWIPEGFAHGFMTLEDDTIVAYKVTAPYNADADRCLRWNDPDLAIHWPRHDPFLSEKDAKAMFFRDFESPFHY